MKGIPKALMLGRSKMYKAQMKKKFEFAKFIPAGVPLSLFEAVQIPGCALTSRKSCW